jgi:hypothetical protein
LEQTDWRKSTVPQQKNRYPVSSSVDLEDDSDNDDEDEDDNDDVVVEEGKNEDEVEVTTGNESESDDDGSNVQEVSNYQNRRNEKYCIFY